MDMMNGQTFLTPVLPTTQHQDNVLELLKTWTHSAHLEQLLLDDVGDKLQELCTGCDKTDVDVAKVSAAETRLHCAFVL